MNVPTAMAEKPTQGDVAAGPFAVAVGGRGGAAVGADREVWFKGSAGVGVAVALVSPTA